MPFDAMKGLQEALRVREERHSRVEKAVLSETQQQEINDVLVSLRGGETLVVTYYQKGHYLTVEGEFIKVDEYKKILLLSRWEIPLDDLYSLEKKDARFADVTL